MASRPSLRSTRIRLRHRTLRPDQRDLNDVPAMRALAVGLCAYEAGAIISRRYPALTTLSEAHPWLKPALVGALFWHLYLQGKHPAPPSP